MTSVNSPYHIQGQWALSVLPGADRPPLLGSASSAGRGQMARGAPLLGARAPGLGYWWFRLPWPAGQPGVFSTRRPGVSLPGMLLSPPGQLCGSHSAVSMKMSLAEVQDFLWRRAVLLELLTQLGEATRLRLWTGAKFPAFFLPLAADGKARG